MTKYPLAERFRAPQGEGLYTGTPFAFMRLVGCSVGQGVCTSCDTSFSRIHASLGGGLYDSQELIEWARPYRHACITGGEPLDRDLRDLILDLLKEGLHVNIETSGTKLPEWFRRYMFDQAEGDLWVCVSPKPGYLDEMIELAGEVKVILGGLGDGPGWPTLEDAVRWADSGKLVYIQPRNNLLTVNQENMDEALSAVDKYPQLRLSAQLHKYLNTR